MRSKVILRKVGVGLKRRWELNKKRLGWRLAWWGSTEKKEVSHLLKLRERISTQTGAPIETELLVRKIIDEKRKVQDQEWILAEHLDGLERYDFLINCTSMPIRKERLSPMSKARRKAR